jgi:hypothetical protein
VHFLPENLCGNLEYSTESLITKQWQRMEIVVHDSQFAKVLVTILELFLKEESTTSIANKKGTLGTNTPTTTTVKWEETRGRLVLHINVGSDRSTRILENVVYNAIIQTLYNTSLQKTHDLIASLHKAVGGVGCQPQSPWFKIFELMRQRMIEGGEQGIIFNGKIDAYRSACDVVNLGSVVFYRDRDRRLEDKKKNNKVTKEWVEVKRIFLCDLFLFLDDKEQSKLDSAKENYRRYTL